MSTGSSMRGPLAGLLLVRIMAKELIPIIFSGAVWGPLFSKRSIELHCNNKSLVDAINKGSSRDETVMHLLRCLWFFTAIFNIKITTSHIPGVTYVATVQQTWYPETRQRISLWLTPKHLRDLHHYPPPCYSLCLLQSWIGLHHPF